ncbi:hypothetical protein [Paraburkholderia sp. JPY419]|uniref:hypothetical protein n=1 Tax=Paraburkholderia sp. JPY419 TaxID=667660 RepID=UPI003D24E36E
MDQPAMYCVLGTSLPASVASAPRRNSARKLLHRVVLMVTDLRLTIFECTVASSAFTKQ